MTEAEAQGLYICGNVLQRARVRRIGRQVAVSLSDEPLPSAAGRPSTGNGGSGSGSAAANGHWPCIACLPGHGVLSRNWSFPRANPQVLQRMIAHRLEAELPVPIDSLAWGYRRSRHAAPDGGVPVFIQAARADHVGEWMRRLTGAGVHPTVLTTEAEALAGLYHHGLHRPPADGAEALILAQPHTWLVAVFADDAVQSVRRVSVAPGGTDLACRECRQLIETQVSRGRLRRAWWCGTGDLVEPPSLLAEQMGVPVERAQPAETLVQADDGPLPAEHLATHGPAIGLALAGLHEPADIIRLAGFDRVGAPGSRLERLLARPRLLAGIAAGALVLAMVVHVAALRSETGRVRDTIAAAGREPPAMADLPARIRAMERIENYRIDIELILAALSAPVPDSIVCSSIQLSRDGSLVLKGTAQDPKAIFALADALRKDPRFANVSPERTEPGQGGGFTVRMDLTGIRKFTAPSQRGATWR